jgi:hypothetical protein
MSFTPWPLSPWVKGPGTHWTGAGWALRAGLNAEVKKKIASPAANQSPVVQTELPLAFYLP